MTADLEFRLDRIELDDAGANPERLATAIHDQLGKRTGPVAVHEIAKALDIEEIREEPLRSMEGALITTAERSYGKILVNSQSFWPRQRFTVAHELGHFLSPWHRPTVASGFECTRADLTLAASPTVPARTRHQVQEIEANRFAIELLMPRLRLASYLSPAADLRHALRMAAQFEVSREAAVRRYVALHPATLAVAFSQNGKLRYIDPGRDFPQLALRTGDPMPSLPESPGGLLGSAMEEVDHRDWLRRSRPVRLQAQVLHQQNGYHTTLLLVEVDDEEEDGEGANDMLDHFTRFDSPR